MSFNMKKVLIIVSVSFLLQSCGRGFFEFFLKDDQCASYDQRYKKKDHVKSDLKNHQ